MKNGVKSVGIYILHGDGVSLKKPNIAEHRQSPGIS